MSRISSIFHLLFCQSYYLVTHNVGKYEAPYIIRTDMDEGEVVKMKLSEEFNK